MILRNSIPTGQLVRLVGSCAFVGDKVSAMRIRIGTAPGACAERPVSCSSRPKKCRK